MLLVDTSVITDFLRKNNKKESLFYKKVDEGESLAVSIITHTELYTGKGVWENQVAQKEMALLFSGLTILPLETNVSTQAGKLRAKYKIDLIDAIIAATALESKLKLITMNKRYFLTIKGLKVV